MEKTSLPRAFLDLGANREALNQFKTRAVLRKVWAASQVHIHRPCSAGNLQPRVVMTGCWCHGSCTRTPTEAQTVRNTCTHSVSITVRFYHKRRFAFSTPLARSVVSRRRQFSHLRSRIFHSPAHRSAHAPWTQTNKQLVRLYKQLPTRLKNLLTSSQ